MSIIERLNADLKVAMKSRDTERLPTLRMAISAMTYRRIERNGELSEQEQLDVMRKQVKQREDSITEFKRGGREDLVAKETRERDILKLYLPAELDAVALRSAVGEALAPLGAEPQLGAAMKAAMAALKDKASGKAIQEAVRAVLEKKTS
ncbi:MAG: GatB/YqeY domain-containing protein [Candidatus Eremiobacteraeota bacterium]|nr:GatB/YqeY domain-containing protein [Candidatus Eremiobacteraeota bacterium]